MATPQSTAESIAQSTPQFHVFLPQMRMSLDTIVDKAVSIERSGFDGLALMDHLAPPGADSQDMWEAMTLAGWLLARTERINLGHLVLCDSFRHPAVLARQAVTLDHACGGRFELGIGWGSVVSEFATFGIGSPAGPGAGSAAGSGLSAGDRVQRLGESLQILNALWSGEEFDFAGRFFDLRHAQQRPAPIGRIPVLIGGVGPKTLELVAKYADWWNLPAYGLDRLDELRPHIGSARVSIQQMVTFIADESHRTEIAETARRRFGRTVMGRTMLTGNSSELVDQISALFERGVERFYIWFSDFASEATLQLFGEEVIPAVRAATAGGSTPPLGGSTAR